MVRPCEAIKGDLLTLTTNFIDCFVYTYKS